ncbi:MAG: hypothetical protein RSH25_12875 [Bacteroides sp.]|uniref:hypothetical protein n=2 Tax=Bacteroides sp. TaxID=29523 RepID=UPI002FC5DE67
MNLNKLRDQIHANAASKGFWDNNPSDQHFLMLVITELSEAVEADRKGRRASKEAMVETIEVGGFCIGFFEEYIKDTIEDELADAFIRLLDLFGAREVYLNENAFDLETIEEYAVTYQGKSFTESVYHITKFICSCIAPIWRSAIAPEMILLDILGFAKHLNIDLMWHVEQKMKYNQYRIRMHGKKY